jgi:hypothetical protein
MPPGRLETIAEIIAKLQELAATAPEAPPAAPPAAGDRVYLAECRCPKDHSILVAIFAAIFDPEWLDSDGDLCFDNMPGAVLDRVESATQYLREQVDNAIVNGQLGSTCAICGAGAPRWSYRTGLTWFTRLEDAVPIFARLELRQRALAQLAITMRQRK